MISGFKILLLTILILLILLFLAFISVWREKTVKVPDAYYNFIKDYAPYIYVIPGSGPDLTWGRAAFAAAFSIDFLYQAYYDSQYSSKQTEIYNKVVSLADWILTQQCIDNTKKAYGGFKSTENSTSYYSVDAARVIPSLIKAYKLTGTTSYLDAAKLAGATFLYNMQHPPSGIVDKYYGGFLRAVDINDSWLYQMDIENLYALIGLKMLVTEDPTNATLYNTMMSDAVAFLRSGFEALWLEYRPPPTYDGSWHRVGLTENEIYDDPFAYALIGLYDYESWSLSAQKVYNFINSIRASAQYPAYNPAICWAGYIDVVSRFPASDYYDVVTSGILWKIRAAHDKPSLQLSMKIIDKHQEQFMFWGVKFTDYSYEENKQAMATVAWLSQLYLNYSDPITNFTRIVDLQGENLILYPIQEAADQVSYGEGIDVKGTVTIGTAGEIIIEPGYILEDHITVYTFLPIRVHDKIRRAGVDYEVLTVQRFDLNGDPEYYKSACRRLIGQ